MDLNEDTMTDLIERFLGLQGYAWMLLTLSELCADRVDLHYGINDEKAALWRRRAYELDRLAKEANGD